MDPREHRKSNPTNTTTLLGKKRAGSVALLLLVVAYGFLQPHINERFGLNLPSLPVAGHTSTSNDAGTDSSTSAQQNLSPDSDSSLPAEDLDHSDLDAVNVPPSQTRSTPTANEISPSQSATSQIDRNSDQIRGPPKDASQDLLFGILREVSHDRFLSPQGLQYLPGSAEGHRLEHLRRHTKDQPTRPGKHGVFDGGMEGTLTTVDSAYSRAKKNQRTTKQTDRNRTVYTVEMGKRVGYVGGREGKRLGNPIARRVKLVLEGTSVITAYPF